MPRAPWSEIAPHALNRPSWRLTVSIVSPSSSAISPRVSGRSKRAASAARGEIEQQPGDALARGLARKRQHPLARRLEALEGPAQQVALHRDMTGQEPGESVAREHAELGLAQRRRSEAGIARVGAADEVRGIGEPDDLLAPVGGRYAQLD